MKSSVASAQPRADIGKFSSSHQLIASCLKSPDPSAKRRTASSRCSRTRHGPIAWATATLASRLRSPARWSNSFGTFAATRPILRDWSRPSRCEFPFTSPSAPSCAPTPRSRRTSPLPATPTTTQLLCIRKSSSTGTSALGSNGTQARNWTLSPTRPTCGACSTPMFRLIPQRTWVTSARSRSRT